MILPRQLAVHQLKTGNHIYVLFIKYILLYYPDLRYSLYIFHTEFIVLKNFLNPKKWMPMDHAHMYSLSWIIIPFKECFKFVIHPVLYSSLNYSALGGPLIWICFRFFNRWRIQFTAHKRQQPTHIYLSFSPADRFSNFWPQSEVHLNAVYSFVLIKKINSTFCYTAKRGVWFQTWIQYKSLLCYQICMSTLHHVKKEPEWER